MTTSDKSTPSDEARIALPQRDYLARGSQSGMLCVSRIFPCRVLWQMAHAHQGEVTALAWSADGKLLASGGEDGRIHIWQATTGVRLCSFTQEEEIERLQWSSGGRLAASSGRMIRLFPVVSAPAAAA